MHFVNYLYDNYLCLLIRTLHSTHTITVSDNIWMNFTLNQQNVKSSLYSLFNAFIGCVVRSCFL